MTDKARELKRKLERIFEAATVESERRARPKNGEVPMDDETRTAFDSVEASTMEAIRQSLDPKTRRTRNDESAFKKNRDICRFRHPQLHGFQMTKFSR